MVSLKAESTSSKEQDPRCCCSALPARESHFCAVDKVIKMWASTNSITDNQQTSLILRSHSGWPQKPANGLEAFSPPTILWKDPAPPSPSDISVWTPSKHLPTTLEDCTEESRQDTDSNSVMVFARTGRLGSPHCMSNAKETSSVGDSGLVLCLPQSK